VLCCSASLSHKRLSHTEKYPTIALLVQHRVLQCVAVCCSVLQYVAVCHSVLQCVAVCCSALQCRVGGEAIAHPTIALSYHTVCCSVSQCVAVCHSVSQCVHPTIALPNNRKGARRPRIVISSSHPGSCSIARRLYFVSHRLPRSSRPVYMNNCQMTHSYMSRDSFMFVRVDLCAFTCVT